MRPEIQDAYESWVGIPVEVKELIHTLAHDHAERAATWGPHGPEAQQ